MPQIPVNFVPATPLTTAFAPFALSVGAQEQTWYVTKTAKYDPENPGDANKYSLVRDNEPDSTINKSLGVHSVDPGDSHFFANNSQFFDEQVQNPSLVTAGPPPSGTYPIGQSPPVYRGSLSYPDALGLEAVPVRDAVWSAGWDYTFNSDDTYNAGSYTSGTAPLIDYVRRTYDAATNTFVFYGYLTYYNVGALLDSSGNQTAPPLYGYNGGYVQWEIGGVVTQSATIPSPINPGGQPSNFYGAYRQTTSPPVVWDDGARPLVRFRAVDVWGQTSSWQKLLFWPVPEGTTPRFIVRASGEIKSRPQSQLYQHPGAARIYAHEPATGTILVSDDEGATYTPMSFAWSDVAGAKPLMTESLGDAGGMSIARVGDNLQFRVSADNVTWETPVTVCAYGTGGWCAREHRASDEALITISNEKAIADGGRTFQSSDNGATWQEIFA